MIIEDKGERSISAHSVADGNGGCEPLAIQATSTQGHKHHKSLLVCEHCHLRVILRLNAGKS